jgi:DNA-binding transcriptional LysR family regulator
MAASSNQLATRVFGRDQSVRGRLRVTLAPTPATHLLMPDFAEFATLHPEFEMEILSSDEPVNLTNREADVAIRVVYNRNTLPLNLHALKGPELLGAVYVSRSEIPFKTIDAGTHLAALRQGIGMTALPCFVGDPDPLLIRVPGTGLHLYGTVWLLTQGETRKTNRVRLFTEFLSHRLSAYAPLLAGLAAPGD